MRVLLCACIVFTVCGSARANEVTLPDDQSLYLQVEVFAALLNDMPEYSNLAAAYGYGGRAGWRIKSFGLFTQFERDYWVAHNLKVDVVAGVLNLGVGAEYLWFGGRVRTSMATGTSTLMFDAIFDDRGTTGFFVDMRPAGLRWQVTDWLTLEFTPISFSLAVPVVGEPGIRKLEYRSFLTLEVPL